MSGTATATAAAVSETPQLEWLARDGRRIVSETGREVLLRGVGLGNWLLPEGYMWLLGDDAASPRQIEQLIDDLVGPEDAEGFWRRYFDSYITEPDIAAIAAYGFNSVRLPINARLVIDEDGALIDNGIVSIDRAIDWCAANGIYAVLDLHAAPGGQTGTNIDDSLGWPNLFTDRRNEELTIALWTALARRYRDQPAVAGFDLLNEPLPGDHRTPYTAELVRLYQELISAIRAVDDRHLIILEGTNWSNDWTMFDELWDDGVVLQFHKYWNAPDVESIQKFLDVRDRLDVPIWLGESGENTLGWYQGTFGVCDELRIGWNFWQWKKLGTRVSPVSVRVPEQWHRIQTAAAGGPRPSRAVASVILDEFLDNIALARCEHNVDVVNSIFRRAPVRLDAEHFAHCGEGISWSASKRASSLHGFRDRDGVTIDFAAGGPNRPIEFSPTTDPEAPDADRLEVCLVPGEWLEYRIETVQTGELEIEVYGDLAEGTLRVSVDGVTASIEDGNRFRAGHLRPGDHAVRVTAEAGAARLRALDIRVAVDPQG